MEAQGVFLRLGYQPVVASSRKVTMYGAAPSQARS